MENISIKKEGPDLTQGTPTALRIDDSTSIDLTRQGIPRENHTNVSLDNSTGAYVKHPYYQIQDMLEDAMCMAVTASWKKQKRYCLSQLKTTANYVQRIVDQLPWITAQSRMKAAQFHAALPHTRRESLSEVKACLEDHVLFLNDATGEGHTLNLFEIRAIITATSTSEDNTPLTLQELRAAAEYTVRELEAVQQTVANLIVEDEDARYPGCRSDEGELIVGGPSK
jgi:hypothetical protein